MQTIQERSKLFCWSEHQVHPYFRIRPLQVELMTLHPKMEVVVYHGILSQRLIGYLRNDQGRNYNVASSLPGGATDTNCLSAYFMAYGNESEDALRMLKLVSMTTGLNALRRPIFIQSFKPGSHYSAHTDSVRSINNLVR